LLMDLSARNGSDAEVKQLATATLQRFPTDARSLAYLNGTAPSAPPTQTAEDYLNLSLSHYRNGNFAESIAAARQALKLRPQFAEAYNNIAASLGSMGQWDDAIAAAQQALKLKPDFALARNNLAWDEEQKQKTEAQVRSSASQTVAVKVAR
jgi:Flp pilus assembly protein TadD